MKRFLLILSLLLALLMLLSACGSKDPAEESIELVAEALFTGPNDFILEHYEEMRSTDIERVDELTEEFRNLFPEVTAVCTESGMDDFVLPAATLQVMEANDGLTSTVKSTKVEVASENSRTYTFTCIVLLESGDERQEVEVSGKVQLNDEGKISYIDGNTPLYVLMDALIRMM